MTLSFPHSSVGKESACNAGDLGLIPGLGRYPGEVKVYSLFWSGEFHGLYSPWIAESDMTEQLSLFCDSSFSKSTFSELFWTSEKPFITFYFSLKYSPLWKANSWLASQAFFRAGEARGSLCCLTPLLDSMRCWNPLQLPSGRQLCHAYTHRSAPWQSGASAEGSCF